MAYLHGKDLIHRDLKLDNILVFPFGVCKVADLGTITFVEDKLEKKTRTRIGTTGYIVCIVTIFLPYPSTSFLSSHPFYTP
jgi:serine/threonine protein kinase